MGWLKKILIVCLVVTAFYYGFQRGDSKGYVRGHNVGLYRSLTIFNEPVTISDSNSVYVEGCVFNMPNTSATALSITGSSNVVLTSNIIDYALATETLIDVILTGGE